MGETAYGSCLCGAVKFEISGDFASFFLCHCGRCRKGSGSAHAANLFAPGAALGWLSGEACVKVYRVPETRHQKCFCTECGSPLPQLQMDGALLVVPAGALDSEVSIRPDAHICWASRAGWDEDLDAVPKLDGLPGPG
jgi:hypothetical protein